MPRINTGNENNAGENIAFRRYLALAVADCKATDALRDERLDAVRFEMSSRISRIPYFLLGIGQYGFEKGNAGFSAALLLGDGFKIGSAKIPLTKCVDILFHWVYYFLKPKARTPGGCVKLNHTNCKLLPVTRVNLIGRKALVLPRAIPDAPAPHTYTPLGHLSRLHVHLGWVQQKLLKGFRLLVRRKSAPPVLFWYPVRRSRLIAIEGNPNNALLENFSRRDWLAVAVQLLRSVSVQRLLQNHFALWRLRHIEIPRHYLSPHDQLSCSVWRCEITIAETIQEAIRAMKRMAVRIIL